MILFGDPIVSVVVHPEIITRLKKDVDVFISQGIETYNPWICDVETTLDLFNIFDEERFSWFKEFLLEKIYQYLIDNNVEKINYDEYMIEGWLNFYKKGQYQEIHDHAPSRVSGNILIQSHSESEESGQFVFYNTKNPKIKSSQLQSNNNASFSEHWRFDPIPGHMLIFPSYLPHLVTHNKTDTTRISLSFNLKKYK